MKFSDEELIKRQLQFHNGNKVAKQIGTDFISIENFHKAAKAANWTLVRKTKIDPAWPGCDLVYWINQRVDCEEIINGGFVLEPLY